MRKSVITPIAAGVLLALAGAAHAVTKNDLFQVTATVSKNCVINAADLNLGTFDGTNDLAASSDISVRCTSGTTYSVDLSAGSSGGYAARTMVFGPDTLTYNLYTDAAHTTVWGDTTGGTGNLTEKTNIGIARFVFATKPSFEPLAVDLVSIDPGTGSSSARRTRLDPEG